MAKASVSGLVEGVVRKTDMDRDLLMASPAVGIMEKVFAGELLFDNMEE